MDKSIRKIVSLCIVIILLIVGTTIYKNNDQLFNFKGTTIALMVDGKKQNEFPTKGFYDVDILCTGANGNWDYQNWKLNIKNITGKVSCDVSFTSTSKVNLNDKVKSLAGNGQVFNEKGYRYEGKKVDNYVRFNNELWRIIGVFGQDRHGQNELELTKIIRAELLGGYAWSKTSYQNNWVNANLNKLLNGAYLNRQDGTDGESCYGYSTVSKGNCDYKENGIASTSQKMIKEVIWYLGSINTSSKTVEEIYMLENGTTGSATSPTVINTTGKIGLMYASDYGYAASSTNCARNIKLNSYEECTGYNWLYGQGLEWTIMASSSNADYAFNISSMGKVEDYYAECGYIVRPTLYLNENVYVVGGKGTEADPYIIAMD